MGLSIYSLTIWKFAGDLGDIHYHFEEFQEAVEANIPVTPEPKGAKKVKAQKLSYHYVKRDVKKIVKHASGRYEEIDETEERDFLVIDGVEFKCGKLRFSFMLLLESNTCI